MERRQQIFHQLKPHCVELSQAVLQLAANNGSPQEVISRLSNLLATIRAVAMTPDALDAKLADYVFFPLSYVLRERQKLPCAAVEMALECITLLLQSGWRSNTNPDLSHQILLLATGFAGDPLGKPQSTIPSEELHTAAFRCLHQLFVNYGENESARKSLTDVKSMGPLGHSVMVILNGVQEGPSGNVQVAASEALLACCTAIQERDALASIMPKIVSTLANVVVPSTQQRRSWKTLSCSLRTLWRLFKTVLNDQVTKDLPQTTDTGDSEKRLTQSWLHATALWIQKALANVIRIRYHERGEVRRALLDLCLVVLQDCKNSLRDSAAIMVETMVVLCGADESSQAENTVRQVLLADPKFAESLRSTIQNWAISLPRVMTSPDDDMKRRTINQISTAYTLLSEQGVDLGQVDRVLAVNLCDGISTAILDSSKQKEIVETSTTTSMDLTAPTTGSLEFEQVLFENESQRAIAQDLQHLVESLSTSQSSWTAARELVDSLHSTQGAQQVASFWTALQFLRSVNRQDSMLNDFLAVDDGSISPHEDLLEDMYTFSLETLQQYHVESPRDWRTQALALEMISFQAQILKDEFRIELVDALYPILHLAGSSQANVRSHAATALNIIAAACGYASVSALIVENVDYLVNAVALKLNTSDISPQAPQVLLMMIKLSGPRLLPYLDDLVGSIFAALESFHGYPRLVELLFKVLRGIAEEGVKAPQLAITIGQHEASADGRQQMTSVEDVIAILDDLKQREAKPDDPVDVVTTAFPRAPWKDEEKHKTRLNEEVDDDDDDDDMAAEQEDAETPPSAPDPPPPAVPIYTLLLKISSLTQYYLSSPSSTLRTSLLSLLNTTFPALAKHENSFLPLINALWPTLVPRLADPEAYVVEGALDVMGAMCAHGGDFMRGRLEGVWERLVRLWITGGEKASGGVAKGGRGFTALAASSAATILSLPSRPKPPRSSSSSFSPNVLSPAQPRDQPLYTTAPSRIIRGALIRLFASAIAHVAVADAAFDQALALLLPVVAADQQLREAFERRNADAVWLALLVREAQGGTDATTREGGGSRDVHALESLGWRRPHGASRGVHFADVF